MTELPEHQLLIQSWLHYGSAFAYIVYMQRQPLLCYRQPIEYGNTEIVG